MSLFTDDLAAIFESDGFAEDAGIDGYTVRVIFDAPYRAISPYDGQIESTGPEALIRDTDVAEYSITSGTVLTIRDTDYSVTSAQPDGTGTTVLVLTKV